MEQILQHYDAYINKLCLRTMVDKSSYLRPLFLR